jgi:acyl-CoA synthetase (AMP-forming)/AMP-acid ligase II
VGLTFAGGDAALLVGDLIGGKGWFAAPVGAALARERDALALSFAQERAFELSEGTHHREPEMRHRRVRIKEQMIEWWGPIIHEYYGASEGGGFVGLDTAEWRAHPGSVGRILDPLGSHVGVRAASHTIRIVDPETGEEAAPGSIGVIYFENALRFEYHKIPVRRPNSSTLPAGEPWVTWAFSTRTAIYILPTAKAT